jgi:hypothetical protein
MRRIAFRLAPFRRRPSDQLSTRPGRLRRRLVAVAAVGALIGAVVPALAQQVRIAGTWSGSGSVIFPSGSKESARCRATFSESGNGASMNASCATASARVNQSAELSRVGANRFIGDFHNAEYNISGSIRITVNGNTLSASLTGGGGTASFSLSR